MTMTSVWCCQLTDPWRKPNPRCLIQTGFFFLFWRGCCNSVRIDLRRGYEGVQLRCEMGVPPSPQSPSFLTPPLTPPKTLSACTLAGSPPPPRLADWRCPWCWILCFLCLASPFPSIYLVFPQLRMCTGSCAHACGLVAPAASAAPPPARVHLREDR